MVREFWLWSWLTDEQKAAARLELCLADKAPLLDLLERDERLLMRREDGTLDVQQAMWPRDLAAGAKVGRAP